MASEDVIELGSSDEETRPTKKIKTNAMVHIPGVTIKPTMPSAVPGGTKGPRIVKVHNAVQLGNKNIRKTNGKSLTPLPNVTRKSVTVRKDLQKGAVSARIDLQNAPLVLNKTLNVNPVTLMKNLNKSQIKINKLPSNMSVLKTPIPVMKGPINIPSSITVKKTNNKSSDLKRPATNIISGAKKKTKINPMKAVREVLTIDSDEEETAKSQSAKPAPGPQWYLRPEDEGDLKTQEEKNETEPECSKFIEITIEDSPVKPKLVKDKRACQVGTELAITIDDSPVKPKETSSDNRDAGETPHSKKKLVYPVETVEIEIEPMEIEESYTHTCDVQEPEKEPFSTVEQTDTNTEPKDSEERDSETKDNKSKSNKNKNKEDKDTIDQQIIEVAESPAKKKKVHQINEPKEAPSKVIDLDLDDDGPPTSSEFHPVYQEFINLCLKIENSVDMNTIVEKKIKSYYRQVPKEYTESEEFIDMVSGKLLSMKAGPEKIYLYIKDVVDELNMQRKLAKQQAINETKKKTAEDEKFLYGEDTEFDSRRQRQIRKLEKTLKKLHRAIQKLEEQEVDFDDEEDSVYLLTERYKERMVRVHAKLCQLTNTKMPSEPRVQIDARPGQPTGPAKRLEKWVNKKVPIGTPLPFPDFHDVLRCVREANEENKLGWNEADIMEEARDLFTRCGKKLQRRRQENEWRLAASRISADIDPAEENEALKKKLEENRQLATKKETDVFNKYADRQSILKLEAEFVGDKEAEESPVESEEEEAVDESCAMKNKERRKERLRRLIQEKPKSSDKSSSPVKEPNVNKTSDEVEIGGKDNADGENDGCNAEKDNDKSEIQEENKDNEAAPKGDESVHSISDSSNSVGSDVDELHLLQKLHSENEVDSSTTESSESMIDISDTIQSDADSNDKGKSDDVISIENSSYSDSEHSNDAKNDKIERHEAERSNAFSKIMDTQADSIERDPNVEQVHLTISDEDRNSKEDNESQGSDVACMNTQDDAISIGDTEIQGIGNPETSINSVTETNSHKKSPTIERDPNVEQVHLTISDEDRNSKEDNESQGSDVACMNTQDDAISIGDTEIQGIGNPETAISSATALNSHKNSPTPKTDENPDTDLGLNNTDKPTINEATNTKIPEGRKLCQETEKGKNNIDALSVTEVSEAKDDKKPLSKESGKDETNRNKETPTVTEFTKDKVDLQILSNKSEKDESECSNELRWSLSDDGIASDKVRLQDADLISNESSLHENCISKTNEHSSCTETDELLEKKTPGDTLKSVSGKVGDMGKETLAISKNKESTKSDSTDSNKSAFQDTDVDMLDDKNKTYSSDQMLEDLDTPKSESGKVGDMGEETLAISKDKESTKSDSRDSNKSAFQDTDVDMLDDKNKTDSLDQMLEDLDTPKSVSGKVGDMGEETLAISKDKESTKSDSTDSNKSAFQETDVDLLDDKNKTDSLDQMLEDFRSDLEANNC